MWTEGSQALMHDDKSPSAAAVFAGELSSVGPPGHNDSEASRGGHRRHLSTASSVGVQKSDLVGDLFDGAASSEFSEALAAAPALSGAGRLAPTRRDDSDPAMGNAFPMWIVRGTRVTHAHTSGAPLGHTFLVVCLAAAIECCIPHRRRL